MQPDSSLLLGHARSEEKIEVEGGGSPTASSAEEKGEGEVNLLDFWYPLCFSPDLPLNRPLPVMLFNEPLVLFRGENGEPICLQDRCAHRSAPLSIGEIKKGAVECRYHGWRFGEGGKCTRIPSLPDENIPKSVRVPCYPATEKEGMVWVWPGDPSKCSLHAGFPAPSPEVAEPAGWRNIDQTIDGDYSYWCLIENLLDPAHLQFTHEGRQGKNIGSPDNTYLDLHDVNLRATEVPGGFEASVHSTSTVKELNFKLFFDPPITVRLEVSFPNGWKFNQMHYCIPLTEGKTRMLLRSHRTWLRFIPDWLFKKSNMDVFYQDEAVLRSQRMRLERGSSRWNYPVKSDAAGIRYRRWRDTVEPKSKPWFKGYLGSSFKKGNGIKRGPASNEFDGGAREGKQGGGEGEGEFVGCAAGCGEENLDVIFKIQEAAPELWPSSKKFEKKGEKIWKGVGLAGQVVFYAGYILAVVAAVMYLTREFS